MTADRFRCDGQCRCCECNPDAFWRSVGISPVSGCYFSAARGHTIAAYPRISVTLDGEPCLKVAREAYVGPDGWVVIYPTDGDKRGTHHCKTCPKGQGGVCMRVLFGHVEVHLGAAA